MDIKLATPTQVITEMIIKFWNIFIQFIFFPIPRNVFNNFIYETAGWGFFSASFVADTGLF